jgi:acetyl esterase
MNADTATALDPQAKAVIDLVIKSGRPAYHQLSPKEARQLFKETRPAATPVPPEIGLVRDLAADGPHGPIPLRLYRPKGVVATAALPTLVFFHGGGWVIGDLDTHDVLCRQLTAEAGVGVIAVDYRLAPEHKFPVAVDDSWAATRWVAAHAVELGVDTSRLAVGGDSAGGNLAAVVALLARDQGGPALALQILIYPVTDLGAEAQSYSDFAEGFMLTRESMRWFRAHYLARADEATDWRVSPLRAASLAGLPPALVVTAGFDPLRDEGAAYARKLREAGVRVDAIDYGGMVHGFAGMGRLLESANRAVAHVAASLRQGLCPPAGAPRPA